MSKLIGIKVDVTKLDKTRFFKAESGAVYADLDVWVNEDADEDWKIVSVNQSQTKEERESKAKKNFCGNGKLLYGWSDAPTSAPAASPATEEDVPW